jgi:hypothetical protein
MALKDELRFYRDRWQAVAEIEKQEMRSASTELRWRQLNAIVGLGIGLGIFKADPSEEEIYILWARLKEKASYPSQEL